MKEASAHGLACNVRVRPPGNFLPSDLPPPPLPRFDQKRRDGRERAFLENIQVSRISLSTRYLARSVLQIDWVNEPLILTMKNRDMCKKKKTDIEKYSRSNLRPPLAFEFC